MATLQINALGAFEIWRGTVRGSVPARAKARALLAYLALQRGTPVSRERLIEIFWPDADPRAGRANLNTAIWDIRRALRSASAQAEDALTTTQSTAQLAEDVAIDAATFVSLASSGDNEMLRQAFALYRGDFLEGDYSEWAAAQRENLAAVFEDVQGRLLWSSRDPALARNLIERNPYHEEAYAILIEHELQSSRIAPAREMAARARAALAEVDVIPSGALSRALRAASAGGETLRRPRSRIPTLLTSYLGRELELQQAVAAAEQTRLLTLTGPGGVGKTRLAIRLAREIEDRFTGGAWFVDLARIERPEQLAKHLCETLGIADEAGAQEQRVVAQLAESRALLILDNCEHLVSACARLVSDLLRQCPAVQIIATSRVRLNVPSETVYQVPPLSLQDAATLFVERARLVERSFSPASAEAIRSVCKRLDCLPFAIELAAARVSIMTVEQLLAEIGQRFDLLIETRRTPEIGRHTSLLQLVNWSYSLLPDEERSALQLSAVFPYDFSLEAFSAVCAEAPASAAKSLETLVALTDKSLVLSEPTAFGKRYRLLETTKQFCQDRLAEAGLDIPARSRHARYYLDYARRTHREFAAANVEAYMRGIAAERENLRAAVTWAMETQPSAEDVVGYIGSLMQYWRESGDFEDGRAWVERALHGCSDLDEDTRAWLHVCGALLAQGSGDFKELKSGVERARSAFDRDQIPARRALFCYSNALSLLKSAQHEDAQVNLLDALAAARAAGDLVLASDALNALANIALQYTGELSRGRELYEEALRTARAAHAPKRAAVILLNLGMLFEQDRDFAAAIAVTQEAIETCDTLPGRPLLDSALVQLATYEDQRGDFSATRTRLREALEFVKSKPNMPDRVAFVLLLEGYVAVAEHAGRTDEAGLVLGFSSAFREMYHIGTDQAHFGGTYDASLQRMRQLLGDGALETLRARGRLMSMEKTFGILERL